MLSIKIVGMQLDKSFASKSGIPIVRKNYIPFRNASLTTVISGNVKIVGVWNGNITHEFKGFYEVDKIDYGLCKSLKRDLIALHRLHSGRVRVIIRKGERELYNDCLPLVNIDCTFKKLKNTLLHLNHINKNFQL